MLTVEQMERIDDLIDLTDRSLPKWRTWFPSEESPFETTRAMWLALIEAAKEGKELRAKLAESETAAATLVEGMNKASELMLKGFESMSDKYDAMKHRVRELEADIAAKDKMIAGLCERVENQAELLSKRAEKEQPQ